MRALLLSVSMLLASCASTRTPAPPGAAAMPAAAVAEAIDPDLPAATPGEPPLPPLATYDPWERFNRGMYRFNAQFDEAVFRPVARQWDRLVPRPARRGLANVFANLAEVGHIANYALQGQPRAALRSLGRLALNTTVGIGGLLDVASQTGLPRAPTSFGTTLARWGVGPGPYLVLPLMGPSSLRDGSGFLADFAIVNAVNLGGYYRSDDAPWLGVAQAVDTRARIDFRYYGSGSPFEYDLLRFLYTRKRMIETGTRPSALPGRIEEAQAPATPPRR